MPEADSVNDEFSNGRNCTGQVDQSNRYHNHQICSKQKNRKGMRKILKGEEGAITLLIYPSVLKEWLVFVKLSKFWR